MTKGGKGFVAPSMPDTQEEMTVVVLRIKGQGDTLRKGFDALNHAFAALGPGQAVVATKRLSAGPSKAGESREDEGEVEIEQPAEIEEGQETVIEAAPASGNGKPRPIQKPKFMDSFDLSASDKPWKDFVAQYAPKNDNERYLLAALWVTENAKTPEFGIGHVFTLFRAARWTEQVDFSQPIRSMKSKNSYFEHPSSKTWKLTQIGLEAARAIAKAGPQ